MGILQSTASANDPLTLNEVKAHFSQTGTKSLRQFLRNGGIVTSSKSTSANQAAPNSDGTTNNFGGVTGLTMVRGQQYGSIPYNATYSTESLPLYYYTNSGDVNDQMYCFFSAQGDFGAELRINGSVVYSSNSTGGGLVHVRTVNASGQEWRFQTSGGESRRAGYAFRRLETYYQLTNNTGNSITVNGVTWSSGSQTISPSGGSYSISYTTSINGSIPTDGTLTLLQFLSADNGA